MIPFPVETANPVPGSARLKKLRIPIAAKLSPGAVDLLGIVNRRDMEGYGGILRG